MSSDEIAIRVHDVSKHYLLFNRPQDRLKQSIVPRLQRLAGRKPKQYYRDFAALSHVSFDVRRGETVGVIGRNGSGKSTLLQVICGTLRPNAGHVEVNGRIAALLELGAGFNPEFTGRENVYLNASILGLPRGEIDARFDDIARFADIGDFIEQPVRTYSSGMYVRLAFATAINVDPDILVVDEALAVGDEAFQRKCCARIEQIQERGGTILFVTHGVQTVVQLCTRALLLDRGELLLDGRPKLVTSQYQRLVNLTGDKAKTAREEIRVINQTKVASDDEVQATKSRSSSLVTPINTQHTSFINEAEAMTADEVATTKSSAPSVVTSIDPPINQVEALSADEALTTKSGPPSVVAPIAPQGGPPIPEGYNTDLVSQSCVEYESHGALIRDLRLLNCKKQQVNILESGHNYTYEYFVDFSVEAVDVGFGMLVKTTSGLEIGGGTTYFDRELRTPRVSPGSTAHVQFEFECSLLPGIYFLNAGVLGTINRDARYLHRLLDCLAFRVVSNKSLVATGLVDLGCRPSVEVTH
ncbi:MAG: ABC transporter ATP-binding protein [Xanthobacteraceae bacterium]